MFMINMCGMLLAAPFLLPVTGEGEEEQLQYQQY